LYVFDIDSLVILTIYKKSIYDEEINTSMLSTFIFWAI